MNSFEQLFFLKDIPMILFFFIIYAFFGWLLENSYNFITKRRFFKPNFFLGPFKPMYGFAPLLLVFFIKPETNWVVVIFLCFFIPTFVEYVSGALLEKFFHQKWWDYSDLPLQIHGHICLSFSLCWIALSLICIHFIHPGIVFLYGFVSSAWGLVWPIVSIYLLVEFILAIKKHSFQSQLVEKHTKPIQ
ncbi:putative membrane protein [Cytobacillus eiseniae]|uniref:Membrane protein n=1 Tax=Cytobacillus eiseniae TaxID=762947 RepID=A0ABS4RAD8_9BACI|nr:putative ABC transporter permease [Cytobacillus eiseniae]MBP2239858.1 putative membrane protein [Cytobacillus eiseniae]